MIQLPMLPPSRPVDPHWECQRSGDCCTKITEVVMTKQEAAHLVHVAPREISLKFRPVDEPGFVAMQAGPCPLYAFNQCLVYEDRPYNCRRFMCLRPDVKAEPFDDGPNGNLWARVKTSRVARRFYARMQRKHQGWAMKMGWSNAAGK